MARRVEIEGIAIQRFRYAETSQIVHVLCPELGRVVVLARGSFRPKNSYHGAIDLLVKARWTVSFLEGRELGVLWERKAQTAYPKLRRQLSRYAAGQHLLRLLLDTTPVGQCDPALYRLFDRALLAAESLELARLPLFLLSYDLHLLRLLGLAPHWSSCLRCERGEGRMAYVAAEGGAVCFGCRQEGEGIALPADAARFLDTLSRVRLQDVETPAAALMRRAEALVESHLGYHLEAPPPARLPRPARARSSRHSRGAQGAS